MKNVPPKQNTNRKWGRWGEKAIACFRAGRGGQVRAQAADLASPVPGGVQASHSRQWGREWMALGSASWVAASSLHPDNQEAAGKETRSILKNDKRRWGVKAAAWAWGGAVQWGQRRRHLKGACGSTRSFPPGPPGGGGSDEATCALSVRPNGRRPSEVFL